MHRNDLMTFLMGHRDNIGDVVFALGVIVGELRQPAFQVRAVSNQNPGIDFLNLALSFAGVFMLNDTCHLAIFTRDTPITGWIIQLHRQQANTALRFCGAQAL